MNTEIILHLPEYSTERESITLIVENNLTGKLDSYLKKLHIGENPVRVELTLKREKDGKSGGKLSITVSGKSYRSEREHFENVHDLVNHLFGHVKDQLVD